MIIKQRLFYILKHPYILGVLSIVPIVVFLFPMLLSGTDSLFAGDFDMQIQMTEAAKKIILEYGQFPFWNPWIAGGVPLFADPQFGLLTPQTLLSFFTDSVYAWKLTIFIYFIIGFFSMRKLLMYLMGKDVKNILAATCISYIWIFGSFFTLRSIGGHFTFLPLMLLPLALYFYLNIGKNIKYTLLLMLLLAYCINATIHYSTILIILTLIVFAALLLTANVIAKYKKGYTVQTFWLLIKKEFKKPALLIAALFGALLINSYRVYQTMEYLHDNSVDRSDAYEQYIGISSGIKALFHPYGMYELPRATFGSFEASNYIGTLTVFALLIAAASVLYISVKRAHQETLSPKIITLLSIFFVVALVSYVAGLAGEPYALLRELPIMSSMRVSTRYFFITTLALLILLSLLSSIVIRKKIYGRFSNLIICTLLAISVVQVFYHSYNLQSLTWVNNPSLIDLPDNVVAKTGQPPKSENHWMTTKNYHALSHGTKSHKVQITADNALVDTRALPTQRCDEDSPICAYVLSGNARVTSWSPNRVILQRSAPGEIKLNVNQSAHWKVNGKYLFKDQKIVESNSTFSIPDDAIITYIIKYSPVIGVLK